MTKTICGPDLGEVLDAGKYCGADAQDVGPSCKVMRMREYNHRTNNHNSQAVEQAEKSNNQGHAPFWLFVRRVGWDWRVAGKEDEEEK